MNVAHAIRDQIEAALAQRVPAALTLKIKQSPELFATGIAQVDAMLGGGIPRGNITEISGASSTGKTTFALAAVASITQLGNACAWIDVSDALSPEAAAASGVELRRLLWLRMSAARRPHKPWLRLEQGLKAADLLLQTGGFAGIVLDMSDQLPQYTRRIPLATWYRFRLAAEQARTALVFLTQSPCASSCASLTLFCESCDAVPFSSHGETPLFERQRYRIAKERNRNESSTFIQKKPPQRVNWPAETLWARVR